MTADSGSTHNYAGIHGKVLNLRPTTNPIRVEIPDGGIMTSTHEGELDLPGLRPEARHVHVFPEMNNLILVSIGQLCDAGYTVHFDDATMEVHDQSVCILTGARHRPSGMWYIAPSPTGYANRMGQTNTADLVTPTLPCFPLF